MPASGASGSPRLRPTRSDNGHSSRIQPALSSSDDFRAAPASWLAAAAGLAAVAVLYAVALIGLLPDDDFLRPEGRNAAEITAPRLANLVTTFRAARYDLDGPGDEPMEVPRLLLRSLPQDWATLDDIDLRKALFVRTVLPLVLEANRAIWRDRRRLRQIRNRRSLSKEEQAWLADAADRYGTAADDLDGLLIRIDEVPPSLALAQAALESGWGTSRFARQGNALFGQWSWAPGSGLVPAEREEGATHEIKTFDRLSDSVRSYMHTLNTHAAYEQFRTERARFRATMPVVRGAVLAPTMLKYSQEREIYVRKILTVIRANRLERFDLVRFRQGRWVLEPDGST